MNSLEQLLENILYKIPFLGITDDAAATNFSAHIGWSIAIPCLSLHFFGLKGLIITTILYTIESLCWKLFTWNYWNYFKTNTLPSDWINDFVVDLSSRLLIPISICIYYLLK